MNYGELRAKNNVERGMMNDERSSLITHHSSPNTKYLILGHLCFLVLLILAAKYANVRVLLTDSAYQLFYDINHPGMLINDSRYSMVFSQILPWIAIHLHFPLKLVIISYSVSFVLVGYACWLLTAYVMKQRQAATLMLFVLLAIGGTFLHCISESFQLMFYVPMLYAWMCVEPRSTRISIFLPALQALSTDESKKNTAKNFQFITSFYPCWWPWPSSSTPWQYSTSSSPWDSGC